MSGPWEDFGGQSEAGPWSDFAAAKPQPIGAQAFPDFLKAELANADWGTREIAGIGTGASNAWEALKQAVGKGDPQQIEANRIIEKAAPAGAIIGSALMAALPFGMAGNTIGGAAKVGTVLGALEPTTTGESMWSKQGVEDKLKSMFGSGFGAAVGQGIANKAGGYVTNKMADLAAQFEKNAPRTQTVNDALDAGLSLSPTSVNPTWWNQLRESVGGKIATAQSMSNKNAPLVDDLMRAEVHLPPNAPLTPGTLQTARDLAYEAGYKPVADVKAVAADEGLINDLVSISPASRGGAVKNPAQSQITDLIDNLANKGEWSGSQLVGDIRALREQARANFRAASMPGGNSGAADLAHAQTAASDALENLAQRNITSQGGSPDALELMREARQYIAKTHNIEDALVGGGGTVDARVLGRVADNNPGRLSGNLATVGNAANNFPKSFQPYAQVNGPAVSKLDAALALAGAAGGGYSGGYEGSAAGALLPFIVPRAARAQMMSRMSQNRLRDIYRLGLPTRAAGSLLQYAPVGGAVLGAETFSQ